MKYDLSCLIKFVPLLLCYHFISKIPKKSSTKFNCFQWLLFALAFEFQNQSNLFNCKLHIIFFFFFFFLTNHLLHVFISTLFYSLSFCNPKKTFSLPLHSLTPFHLYFFLFILPFASCSFGFISHYFFASRLFL